MFQYSHILILFSYISLTDRVGAWSRCRAVWVSFQGSWRHQGSIPGVLIRFSHQNWLLGRLSEEIAPKYKVRFLASQFGFRIKIVLHFDVGLVSFWGLS